METNPYESPRSDCLPEKDAATNMRELLERYNRRYGQLFSDVAMAGYLSACTGGIVWALSHDERLAALSASLPLSIITVEAVRDCLNTGITFPVLMENLRRKAVSEWLRGPDR